MISSAAALSCARDAASADMALGGGAGKHYFANDTLTGEASFLLLP